MASIKVKFHPSAASDREGTIYYQITHDRKVRQILSGHKIFPNEWDDKHAAVVVDSESKRAAETRSVREQIRFDIERMTRIIRALDSKGLDYTADDIVDEYIRHSREYSLFNYMQSLIASLKQCGRIRTAETYTSALSSVKRYLGGRDIMLDAITPATMQSYEAHLKLRGNTPNTTSFYMRILRAVYNHAIANDIIDDRRPFRKVFTGSEETAKRALPLSKIKAIKTLDLSHDPKAAFARDMFMMSFYLRGMSFIDMACLRKADLVGRNIIYRRRKTGQRLTICWTAEMQAILDNYPDNPGEYLLPIITKPDANQRRQIRNVGERINRHLKQIARQVGIAEPLTLYCARHSWASAAKAKGIPVSVISEGLGHDSETTTRIYLAELDTSVVDKANSLIIDSLK